MKISTRGRYAVVVMIDLAKQNSNELINAKDIAARSGISAKCLEKILTILSKSGYVYATRGKNGGYRLAKPSAEYTVGDILRALEDSLEPVSGLVYEMETLSDTNKIENLPLWKGLYDAIKYYIDGITLEDLAKNEQKLETYNYSI